MIRQRWGSRVTGQTNGVYARYIKRILGKVLAVTALLILLPLFLLLTLTGAAAMRGNPFFVQPRPGKISPKTGREQIFRLIKFRTMDNRRDRNGKLLPDEERLNAYGRFLRRTSLDELPQLLNVISGTGVFVGPRPMLVRDMVFMSPQVRRRHTVWPGITGWAQVHGRNSISWEEKFVYDLEYIDRGITFRGDLQILAMTLMQVFKHSDVNREGTASDLDYGDWLLADGGVTQEEYDKKQREALELLRGVS